MTSALWSLYLVFLAMAPSASKQPRPGQGRTGLPHGNIRNGPLNGAYLKRYEFVLLLDLSPAFFIHRNGGRNGGQKGRSFSFVMVGKRQAVSVYEIQRRGSSLEKSRRMSHKGIRLTREPAVHEPDDTWVGITRYVINQFRKVLAARGNSRSLHTLGGGEGQGLREEYLTPGCRHIIS